MGGSPSKVIAPVKNLVKPTVTPPKPIVVTKTVEESLKSGNQIFMEKDVREKILEVSKVFEAFNKDDHKLLLEYVDSINMTLQKNGSPEFKISDPVRRSLAEFHTAVLNGLENAALKTDSEKSAMYSDIMKNGKIDDLFHALSRSYTKEFDEKKDRILTTQGIVNNDEMKKNISSIMNTVKTLKIKSKYFEYKYIELNIFLILFVQQTYIAMDSFVKNIMDFNSQRDMIRESMIKDTMKVMTNILTSADLQINPQDFNYITDMIAQLRKHMENKNLELQQKLQKTETVAHQQVMDVVNQFTSASQIPTQKPNEPFNYYNKPTTLGQQGGYIRDGSMFPQAFYDLVSS